MKRSPLVIVLFLFIHSSIFAQKMDAADTALIKKYWNKIQPASTTSLSGCLYSGIDNYLKLKYPDEASKQFAYIVTTNNGKIINTERGYLNIPDRAGWSFFNIYLITYNSDTFLVGKKQFTVQNLPYPTVKVGNTILSEGITIDKSFFFTNDSVKLFFTTDIPSSDKWYKIERFSIGYIFGSVYISEDNEGPKIGKKMRELIHKVNPGKEVMIKVNTVTPTRVLRYLPIVKFKIM